MEENRYLYVLPRRRDNLANSRNINRDKADKVASFAVLRADAVSLKGPVRQLRFRNRRPPVSKSPVLPNLDAIWRGGFLKPVLRVGNSSNPFSPPSTESS